MTAKGGRDPTEEAVEADIEDLLDDVTGLELNVEDELLVQLEALGRKDGTIPVTELGIKVSLHSPILSQAYFISTHEHLEHSFPMLIVHDLACPRCNAFLSLPSLRGHHTVRTTKTPTPTLFQAKLEAEAEAKALAEAAAAAAAVAAEPKVGDATWTHMENDAGKNRPEDECRGL